MLKASVRARNWFDPREGLSAMSPLDYAIAGLLGLGNFMLSFVGYWWQPVKYFDENYFARAGEEYLQNLPLNENTHPPLSKLLITLSMMLFGGMPHGDNGYGWRFLDVVFGALLVMLLYAFAKRVTGSTVFSTIAALLLTFDGMHFVQSRIATPEGFVVLFSTLSIYALYRFWISSQDGERPQGNVPAWGFVAGLVAALLAGFSLGSLCRLLWSFNTAATIVASCYFACGLYLIVRYAGFVRWFGSGKRECTYADGSYALRDGGAVLQPRRAATLWLVLFGVALGLLVSTKWYGVMTFGVGLAVLAGVWLQRFAVRGRPTSWGNPRGFRLDGALAAMLFVSSTVYALVWVPDVARKAPDFIIQSVNDVVDLQYRMFEYHENLRATHPYASKWWEWPLDYVPIVYFSVYAPERPNGTSVNASGDKCCVYIINSLPNPIVLWFGLFCVPVVAVLAWRERRKGYALIVLAYLLQWLPWAASPRIAFEYHFYVNIPLICLCNAIVLQRFWQWCRTRYNRGWLGYAAAGAYTAATALFFVYFYPLLAFQPISWNAWQQRMWLPTWVIGPG